MESPHNSLSSKEFEVTGVSRSGRVRKKSSKLLDFQSPDDCVERKVYKRPSTLPALAATAPKTVTKYSGRGRPSLAVLQARRKQAQQDQNAEIDGQDDDDDDDDMDDGDENYEAANETGEASDNLDMDKSDDEPLVTANSSGLTADSETDDDGFGELVADIVSSGTGNLNGNPEGNNVRSSLYMSEKNDSRRRTLKEGRIIRKDKGKSRLSAYTMWSKEYRKSSKFGKNQDIESASTSRRLSELWANVSNKEKQAWRKKAKVQSARVKQNEKYGPLPNTTPTAVINSPTSSAINSSQNYSFINRPTTSRTRKLAEEKQKVKDDIPSSSTPKRTRNNSYRKQQVTDSDTTTKSLSVINGSTASYAEVNSSATTSTLQNSKMSPLPSIEPIDSAAHLKLLGESLTIIGDRLKEHEGQIAVSGSLSVLLDSLLCSLGPLLCLTTRLPGLDKKTQLKENLARTLDNIAYVMPGL